MTRTTNKEFKEAVRQHILDILSEDHGSTTKERLQAVVEQFNAYYTRGNYQDAFVDFCQGLPSVLNVEFRTHRIDQILDEWFATIGKKYNPDKLEDPMDFYCRLIHRELGHLLKNYEIDGGLIK